MHIYFLSILVRKSDYIGDKNIGTAAVYLYDFLFSNHVYWLTNIEKINKIAFMCNDTLKLWV